MRHGATQTAHTINVCQTKHVLSLVSDRLTKACLLQLVFCEGAISEGHSAGVREEELGRDGHWVGIAFRILGVIACARFVICFVRIPRDTSCVTMMSLLDVLGAACFS